MTIRSESPNRFAIEQPMIATFVRIRSANARDKVAQRATEPAIEHRVNPAGMGVRRGRMGVNEVSGAAGAKSGFLTQYRDLLSEPGVFHFVVAGIISRLPIPMLSLALPLLVVGHSGSYVSAGLITGLFTIAAGICGPLRGRASDRLGVTPVLMITGWGQAACLVGLVLSASSTHSILWMSATAIVAGALVPPVSPVMRVLWTREVPSNLRDVAFAFESITADILYIAGPLLVTVLIAIAPIEAAIIVAAGLSAIGAAMLALTPGARRWQTSSQTTHWIGPLRSSAVRRMLPIGALIPGSLTAVELGIIAFSGAHQARALSGVLIAAMSVGSIVGGIYWGSRLQPGTPRRQLTLLLACMAAGMALLAIASNIFLLGALLVVVGLALAPSITVEYSLMAEVAPEEEMTESFAWLNSLGQAGAAGSVVVAGLFVTRLHDTGGFVFAAVLAAVTVIYSLILAPDS